MAFLAFKKISKRFPGVVALDDVSFEIDEGSCHALIGENGAGKSTQAKSLAGIYAPDEGAIVMAEPLKIAMVHQELAFCPNLTVAENLCLGDLPQVMGFLDRSAMRNKARAMLREIEANIDV